MRNVKIDEVDRLDRDVVALGNDYAQGFILPPHQHRRAQLLYGATGLMYVTTQDGEWVVPPQHAVWIPPETVHAVRFAGVTTLPRTLIIARHLLHQYGFHQHCAALHAIDLPVLALEDGSGLAQEKVRERCIRALKEDGSGAIVLGCGGMATLAQELTRELRVPVIDGVSAAVKMVESLVALGLATSKHGDLAFPEKKALSGQFQSLNPF
ncbi:hydantoin racemase [Klebsiella pneumoniae]|nr:hydantoin racemase [Klebsiella pneumoniae]